MSGLQPNEVVLFDDVSRLAKSLWDRSKAQEGYFSDPRMMSVILFRRLWSHHRGYAVLYNAGLILEGDIVLRAGVEAAICIAANSRLGSEFQTLMRQDAAATLQGQIKIHRAANDVEMVQRAERELREMLSTLPDGRRPARLSWEDLAKAGEVPQLYSFHRNLSGTSSHVTGLSILRGIGGEGALQLQEELFAVTKRRGPLLMMAATLHGSLIHARVLEDGEHAGMALAILAQLNEASKIWNADSPTEAEA